MAQGRLDKNLLENRIGYKFNNIELLERALTHSSYSNESGVRNHHMLCNERLEFLGDSVLSIITSSYLYGKFTDCPEGELTRMRAEVVCERALSGYAMQIGLGRHLLLGIGEEKNNGRERRSILADAFEALLAAIYLDAGEDGLEKVKALREEITRRGLKVDIQVDGGISDKNARDAKEAGANVLVAGSAVFRAKDRAAAIRALKEA